VQAITARQSTPEKQQTVAELTTSDRQTDRQTDRHDCAPPTERRGRYVESTLKWRIQGQWRRQDSVTGGK